MAVTFFSDVGFPWQAVVGRCVDWTALRWAAGAVPIDTGGYNMVCGCESGVGETVGGEKQGYICI